MESYKASKKTDAKKGSKKEEESKDSWFESLAKLKRMSTHKLLDVDADDPSEKKENNAPEDTYEKKKKRELAKIIMREFA